MSVAQHPFLLCFDNHKPARVTLFCALPHPIVDLFTLEGRLIAVVRSSKCEMLYQVFEDGTCTYLARRKIQTGA